MRLTERFGEDAENVGAHVRRALPELEVTRAIGVAGTITTSRRSISVSTEYDAELVHGHRLPLASVSAQLERLASLPLAERRRVPGLEPDRAPVIVAGTVILREVLRRYQLDAIEVSVHDLLDGVALAAAELPELEEGAAPPGAFTCC